LETFFFAGQQNQKEGREETLEKEAEYHEGKKGGKKKCL